MSDWPTTWRDEHEAHALAPAELDRAVYLGGPSEMGRIIGHLLHLEARLATRTEALIEWQRGAHADLPREASVVSYGHDSANEARSSHSAVLAGENNTVSGERSVIIGGQGVTLSAPDSCAIACQDIEIDGPGGQVWAGNERVDMAAPESAIRLRGAIADALAGIRAGLCPTCYRRQSCDWHIGGDCPYEGRGLPRQARRELRQRLHTWHPDETPGPEDEAAFLVAVDATLEGMKPEAAEAASRVIERIRTIRATRLRADIVMGEIAAALPRLSEGRRGAIQRAIFGVPRP